MSIALDRFHDPNRISVIIPVYNGASYLREAIDSVLAQTRTPDEIIVVNDGSTDRSAEILDIYGDRLERVDQSNAGTAAARNRGVEASTGGLLAFLDQDDLWTKDKLQRQFCLLTQSEDTQLVWGGVQQFVSPELPSDFRKKYRCQENSVPGYLPSALLIRRKAFDTIGPFDTRWRLGEWADWYARCANANLASDHVDGVVSYRRIHEGNKGITMAEDRREYVSLIRENLKRKAVERA